MTPERRQQIVRIVANYSSLCLSGLLVNSDENVDEYVFAHLHGDEEQEYAVSCFNLVANMDLSSFVT